MERWEVATINQWVAATIWHCWNVEGKSKIIFIGRGFFFNLAYHVISVKATIKQNLILEAGVASSYQQNQILL